MLDLVVEWNSAKWRLEDVSRRCTSVRATPSPVCLIAGQCNFWQSTREAELTDVEGGIESLTFCRESRQQIGNVGVIEPVHGPAV
jgi:hypothetical protein